MFKKIISVLLMLTMCGFSNVAFAADGGELSIQAETVTISQGTGTVTEDFYVTSNSGMVTVGFNVNYDQSVLTIKEIVNGEIYNDSALTIGNVNNSPYVVSYLDISGDNSKTGKLVSIEFEVKDGAKAGTYPITLEQGHLGGALNYDEQWLDLNLTDGAIIIEGDSDTQEEETETTTADQKKETETTTSKPSYNEDTSKADEVITPTEVVTEEEKKMPEPPAQPPKQEITEPTTVEEPVTEPVTVGAEKESNEVRIQIGSSSVSINGQNFTMDAAAYIQPSSNSTLVPLRFSAIAVLGGSVGNADNSSIVQWDNTTKTASINADKTITFTAGSNIMTVDGESIAMGNGVTAEIKDGRMYIPFRALGEALGISVDWDGTTRTAIYRA